MRPERLCGRDGADVWQLLGPVDASQLGEFESFLSNDERERVARFGVDEARDKFIISRGALRAVLAPYLGCEPGEIRFRYGPAGKPHLANEADVHFNVAHSGWLFLYAVSRGHKVGVDVEEVRDHLEVERLAERFFAPGEARRLGDAKPEDRIQAFHRCWTRKEAYLKLKGFGIADQLDKFEVSLLPHEEPALLTSEVDGEDPARWRFSDLTVPPGYIATLVVAPA